MHPDGNYYMKIIESNRGEREVENNLLEGR